MTRTQLPRGFFHCLDVFPAWQRSIRCLILAAACRSSLPLQFVFPAVIPPLNTLDLLEIDSRAVANGSVVHRRRLPVRRSAHDPIVPDRASVRLDHSEEVST